VAIYKVFLLFQHPSQVLLAVGCHCQSDRQPVPCAAV